MKVSLLQFEQLIRGVKEICLNYLFICSDITGCIFSGVPDSSEADLISWKFPVEIHSKMGWYLTKAQQRTLNVNTVMAVVIKKVAVTKETATTQQVRWIALMTADSG